MLVLMSKRRKKRPPEEIVSKLITQPSAWWDAFREQADRDGVKSMGEWIGAACLDKLEADLRANLPERPIWGKEKHSDE